MAVHNLRRLTCVFWQYYSLPDDVTIKTQYNSSDIGENRGIKAHNVWANFMSCNGYFHGICALNGSLVHTASLFRNCRGKLHIKGIEQEKIHWWAARKNTKL